MKQLVVTELFSIEITPQGGQIAAAQPDILWQTTTSRLRSGFNYVLCGQVVWTVPAGKCRLGKKSHRGGRTAQPIYGSSKKRMSGQPLLRVGDAGICEGVFADGTICRCEFKIIAGGQTGLRLE